MPEPDSGRRLLSLDVFRGITIAGMIFVDSPGNNTSYRVLTHAHWNGWTFADLVFPSFLVIMGVSLGISLSRRLARGENSAKIKAQILRRTVIIFALGLLISAFMFNTPATLRIPGVLQRIAVCYLCCSILYLATGPLLQAIICGALLIGYWLLMTLVSVPGHGAGVLTPDGNLACWVDRSILGRHMMAGEACDPEGILSTIPAIATALLGVLAGQWIIFKDGALKKILWLAAAGGAAIGLGLLWKPFFPVNKHIWSSSYALLTGGMALLGLTVCYIVIEEWGLKAWGKPFEIFGRNPLLSYFLGGLFYGVMQFIDVPMPGVAGGDVRLWLCSHLFGRWMSPMSASAAFALAYVLFCLGVMTVLYRKGVFLKI